MSAENIEYVIKCGNDGVDAGSSCYQKARAELAQLSASAAERDAAHVYLDESPVNDPNDDTPHTLAERIAAVVNDNAQQAARIAELEAAVSEARIAIEESLETMELEGVGYGNSGSLCRAWLAAHPAPAPSPSEHDAALLDEWHERM